MTGSGVVLDTQKHLPSDEGKGGYLGLELPDAEEYGAAVRESLESKFENTTEYAVIPTIKNRRPEKKDEPYLKSLEDSGIKVPATAVELEVGEHGEYGVNIIGAYDPSYFEDLDKYSENAREEFIDAVLEHNRKYKDSSALLLGHPFSGGGGILRGLDRGSGVYNQIKNAAKELDVYTDQNGNAWLEKFKKQPWTALNDFKGDLMGLNYWNIEEDADCAIKNVGCSDAKDPELAGQAASHNPGYSGMNDMRDVKEFLDSEKTSVEINEVPTGKFLRKMGDGIEPVRTAYSNWEELDKYKTAAIGLSLLTTAYAAFDTSGGDMAQIVDKAAHYSLGVAGSLSMDMLYRLSGMEEDYGKYPKYGAMAAGGALFGALGQAAQFIIPGKAELHSIVEGTIGGGIVTAVEAAYDSISS
ncbi:MAG: hypothetical protein SVV03_03755 [Candidatus Nanohaloarchaea archaeon]|nr:hypothetical protein [Candidatus Nanohaloarchaea archaeon]